MKIIGFSLFSKWYLVPVYPEVTILFIFYLLYGNIAYSQMFMWYKHLTYKLKFATLDSNPQLMRINQDVF